MEADAPAVRAHLQGELGPILVDPVGGDNRRVRDVAFAEPADGVAHKRAPALELSLVVHMLQLTAAAVVPHVMGAAWLYPVRRRLEKPAEAGAGEALVFADAAQLD
jgi:hypothetical protein